MTADLHPQAGARIVSGAEPRPFWFLRITVAALTAAHLTLILLSNIICVDVEQPRDFTQYTQKAVIRGKMENGSGNTRRRLSKSQRMIAEYISGHGESAAYMTAAQMGLEVGVSESTVVRYAMHLGYDGYPEFQKDLQQRMRSELTAVQRIEVANQRFVEGDLLKNVLASDMDKIKKTLESVDSEQFYRAVERIVNADSIFIIGVRSCAPLASFLYFYFRILFEKVRLINSTGPGEMFEELLHLGKNDAFIAISFPRYSLRVINSVEYARSVGAGVVAVTDSPASPIARGANEVLCAKSDMASFADSLVAPLSLLNALIAAVGKKRQKFAENAFARLEDVWDEYGVYAKGDDLSDGRGEN